MTATGFRILHGGLLTLVQDMGRFGYQHLGISPGGVADEQASLWANHLLENGRDCPVLEICYGGLEIESHVSTQFAITGADLQATRNGQPIVNWQTHRISPGDILKFSMPRAGIRSYLAVKGGFDIPKTLGSVATVRREQLGGLDGLGSALKKNDWLPCHPYDQYRHRSVPFSFIPDYRQSLVLSVVRTVKNDAFSESDIARLFSETYKISPQSNAMGIRLEGAAINRSVGNMISEGTSFGQIQIPPDGQPIILLKDRQTIGGYPVIGTVFGLDAFLLAQQQANTVIRFFPVDLETAQSAMHRFYQFFNLRC